MIKYDILRQTIIVNNPPHAYFHPYDFYMISPFDQITTFTVYLEPYLHQHIREYQNILTVDKIPSGPLQELVTPLRPTKLSPFQPFYSPFDDQFQCKYAIIRYPGQPISQKCYQQFLTHSDIPSLLGFLASSGYTVNTDITKVIQRSNVMPPSGKRMVCVASYQ